MKQLNDPVIDEVREVRHRISARFGHNPERLVAYYLQLQQQFRERLIEPVASTALDQPAAELLHGLESQESPAQSGNE